MKGPNIQDGINFQHVESFAFEFQKSAAGANGNCLPYNQEDQGGVVHLYPSAEKMKMVENS